MEYFNSGVKSSLIVLYRPYFRVYTCAFLTLTLPLLLQGRHHRHPGGDPRQQDQVDRRADAGHLQGLRRQEGLQERGGSKRNYRVTLVVEYLGWVELDLGCSTILLGQ